MLAETTAAILQGLHRLVIVDRIEFVFHQDRQIPQAFALALGGLARLAIDHAQRAYPAAVTSLEWLPGIEANIGRFGDQWVIGKTRIEQGVGNDEQAVFQDGMTTKGDVAGGFTDIQAYAGFKPLPIAVDQGNHGDRGIEDGLDQPSQAVETFLGGRIQYMQGPQGRETAGLIGGDRWRLHSTTQSSQSTGPAV